MLPANAVRGAALRMLRVHPRRAADSLLLAAAIAAAEHDPAGLDFVSLGDRFVEAAGRVNSRVVRL